jgi:hypothetical protein
MAVLLAGVSSVPFCDSGLVAPAYDSADVAPNWTLLIYYSVDYVAEGVGDRDLDRDRGEDGDHDSDHVGDDINSHPYSTPEDAMEVELAALLEATRPASDNVNILVLVDELTRDGISLFEIADGAVIPLDNWEEQNTADPAVLEAFVTFGVDWEEKNTADPTVLQAFVAYGLNRYPYSTTALFITGDGHGWRGICRDRDPEDPEAGEDLMSVDEIAQVLVNTATEYGAVDLLVFNGANMASIEVAYELRDAVPYMVATQSQIQEDGIPYGMFVADLIADPNMSVTEFSTSIVEAHVEYYGSTRSGTSVVDRTRTNIDSGSGDCDQDMDNGEASDSDVEPDGGTGGANGSLGTDPGASGDGQELIANGGGQIAQDFTNMFAFDMARIAEVVDRHAEFSSQLAALMEDLHNVIPAARDASMVGHHNDISDYDYLSDIYTFISLLEVFLRESRADDWRPEYDALITAMTEYRAAHEQAVVAEAMADKFHNTNGLSIWYPGSLTSYELRDSGNVVLKFGETFFYEDPALGLDFVTDSSWVDYLYAYYLAVGGHGSE